MSTLERTKVERFLPYVYARSALDLTVERMIVDGSDRTELARVDSRLVSLEDKKPERVELDVAVTLPGAVVHAVTHESEHAAPPIELLLVVRCPRTRMRRGLRLDPGAGGVHRVHFTLQARDVFGSVELVAYLIRAREGASQRRHATHLGARLASSRPWWVRFDLERVSPGQFLDVRYEPFSALTDPELWRGNLYRLDAEQDTPILWLNSEHREVAEVLDSKATTGRRARIRDVFFCHIVHAVWTQLFAIAAGAVAADAEVVAYAWCDSVLDRFLPSLFPDLLDQGSRNEALAQLWGAGSTHEVLSRLDRVLQRDLALAKTMTKLVEEAIE